MNGSSTAAAPSAAAAAAPATPKLNCCQQVLVALLILLETASVVFSAVTLSSCNFFQFSQVAGNVPLSDVVPEETSAFYAEATSVLPNGTSTLLLVNVTEAGFGLLQWSPNLLGCADYADRSNLGTAFRTGQVGGLMGVSFGLAALLLNSTELLCCRFVCAKVLACLSLIAALVGQGLTFVLYASDICLNRGNVVYACTYGPGCGWSVAAFLCLLLASLLICPTPKPTPLCKKVCEKRNRDAHDAPVTDPCCYCFRGRKDEDDKKKKEEEEEEKKKADGVEEGDKTAAVAATGPTATKDPVNNTNSNVPSTHDDSVYNDTMTDDPNAAAANGGYYRSPPPVVAPSDNYPQEVYTRSRTAPAPPPPPSAATDASTQAGGYDNNGPYYYGPSSSAASVPGVGGGTGGQYYYYYRSPPPPPPPPPPQPPQYHYYAPRAPPPQSSFANAEVMDGDLFFDSKTV